MPRLLSGVHSAPSASITFLCVMLRSFSGDSVDSSSSPVSWLSASRLGARAANAWPRPATLARPASSIQRSMAEAGADRDGTGVIGDAYGGFRLGESSALTVPGASDEVSIALPALLAPEAPTGSYAGGPVATAPFAAAVSSPLPAAMLPSMRASARSANRRERWQISRTRPSLWEDLGRAVFWQEQ